MVLVITAIGIVIGVVGGVMYSESKNGSYVESVGTIINYTGWTIALVGAIAAIGLLIGSLCMATADEKIEMYQEENTKIEQQIADVVEQYQKYETDIFTELSPESSMTMISLYPELKSDKLVEHQIDTYVKNNEQIKYWRGILIDRTIVNWWLYFGK